MKKLGIILGLAFVIFAAHSVFGQDGATISADAFATTTNGRQISKNNVGLALRGEFKYERLSVGGEGIGHDSNPARLRAYGAYDVLQWKKVNLSAGGGFWRFGSTNGGFGQVGMRFYRLDAFGRYGDKNFTEAEGSFRVLSLDHFAIGPFYRFSRHGDIARQDIQTAGLRLWLK